MGKNLFSWLRPQDTPEVAHLRALMLDEGQQAPLKCRVSTRAKRLSLRLSAKESTFVLTVPPRVSAAQVDAFLIHCRPWALREFQRMGSLLSIEPGKSIDLHGMPYHCMIDPLRKKPALCKATQTLFLPPQYARVDLHRLLRKFAEEALMPHLFKAAGDLGQEIKQVTIRDTKSRWGSCSGQKTISLNWRLVLAPVEVARYVCIHEAVHLLHMNHSAAFWKQVAALCPSYKTHQKWLKAHGPSLMGV